MEQTKDGAVVQVLDCSCVNCGGMMKWNIAHQKFECVSCQTAGQIVPLSPAVTEHDINGFAAREKGDISFPERAYVICKGCGAQVVFDKDDTAVLCPMCSSAQVAADRQKSGVPPDGVVPFRVDKAQAQMYFKKWVKSRFFAPNRLKEAYQQGKLTGMYLPFWTYDAKAQASYRGQGGHYVQERGPNGKIVTRTVWHTIAGVVSSSYDDIQVGAMQDSEMEVVNLTLPYNTRTGCVPYSPAYLFGFCAEHYSYGAPAGFSSAQRIMENDLSMRAQQDIMMHGFEVAQVTSISPQFSNVRYKQVLVPVWVSAFAYAGKQFLYAINGETGRVSGSRPYSVVKIAAAVIVLLVAVMALTTLLSEPAEDGAAYEDGSYYNNENDYNNDRYYEDGSLEEDSLFFY